MGAAAEAVIDGPVDQLGGFTAAPSVTLIALPGGQKGVAPSLSPTSGHVLRANFPMRNRVQCDTLVGRTADVGASTVPNQHAEVAAMLVGARSHFIGSPEAS